MHLNSRASPLLLTIIFIAEMVEEFVKVYPNLEHVYLESRLPLNDSSYEKVRVDEEGLSAIRFQNLTSLSLSGFHLDGSSLQTVIRFCNVGIIFT